MKEQTNNSNPVDEKVVNNRFCHYQIAYDPFCICAHLQKRGGCFLNLAINFITSVTGIFSTEVALLQNC